MNITKFRIPWQDKNAPAWIKLCEYIALVAAENRTEFSPATYLGRELFAEIQTLPASIGNLKSVERMKLYGSNIRLIPPEIGKMTALKHMDAYTSGRLLWFPYEITHCQHLIETRVSTRMLYGNYKNRKPFPDLTTNPLRYDSETLRCSVCDREIPWTVTNQVWISLRVGKDVMPLLANLCSETCTEQLPAAAPGYIPRWHKGGPEIIQKGLLHPRNIKERYHRTPKNRD